MSFNVKLFDKMVAHVVAVPDRLIMNLPIQSVNSEGLVRDWLGDGDKSVYVKPPCGTAGCAGGWTVLLGEPGRMRDKFKKWNEADWENVSARAAYLLGVDEDILDAKLFHVHKWPEKYSKAWKKARKPSDRVAIFAERAAQFRAWALEEGL